MLICSWNSLGKPLVNGVLTMTRSIGDIQLKPFGVTAEPETRSLEVSKWMPGGSTLLNFQFGIGVKRQKPGLKELIAAKFGGLENSIFEQNVTL